MFSSRKSSNIEYPKLNSENLTSPQFDGTAQSEHSVDESVTENNNPKMASAYQRVEERKEDAKRRKSEAVSVWVRRVMYCSICLIITSGFILVSQLWYANILGVAAAILGIYGAYKRQSEFIFVYLVLLGLELLKNIGVFVFYAERKTNWHYVLIMIDLVIEEFFLVPISIYQAFFLYRTLNVANENENGSEY